MGQFSLSKTSNLAYINVGGNFNCTDEQKRKIILLTLGGLITTLVVYVTVRLGTSDAAFSIVPGWHTTIYPPEITWTVLTIIILITSVLVYLVFRGTVKLLTSLWTRVKS